MYWNLCLPACKPVSVLVAYSHAEREYVREHTFRDIFFSRLTRHSTPCGVVKKVGPARFRSCCPDSRGHCNDAEAPRSTWTVFAACSARSA